jgi:glycosyltransferase involved in cell wall biosynthesis
VYATKNVELSFVGYGAKDYVNQLLDRIKTLGIEQRVKYLGTPSTREELYHVSRGSHVGLVLFQIPFRDSMAGASQKPFEYMAAGMMLMVPELPEWDSFAVQTGFGIACLPHDVSNIIEKLQFLQNNRALVEGMRIKARERILHGWNYENFFLPVVETVERLVAREN